MLISKNDSIHVLAWNENITLQNVDMFRREMELLLTVKKEGLVLNLANTQYINSAGLGIIANSVMEARRNQKELILVEIHQILMEIFSMVKFTSFIKILETEEEANQYFMESHDEQK